MDSVRTGLYAFRLFRSPAELGNERPKKALTFPASGRH